MKCDGCTFCCRMLDVPWLGKPAGQQCEHAQPGKGCGLWPDIPPGCAAFECMYRSVKCSPDLQPDRCGVMFERIDPAIVFGTMAGDDLTRAAMGQVASFSRERSSVVLSTPGDLEKTVFTAPGAKQSDVTERVEQLIAEARDGSA